MACLDLILFKTPSEVLIGQQHFYRIFHMHVSHYLTTRPLGYKSFFFFFFMLNLTEDEICFTNKSQITNNCEFCLAKHIPEHENFSAYKFENANYCWHFHIY